MEGGKCGHSVLHVIYLLCLNVWSFIGFQFFAHSDLPFLSLPNGHGNPVSHEKVPRNTCNSQTAPKSSKSQDAALPDLPLRQHHGEGSRIHDLYIFGHNSKQFPPPWKLPCKRSTFSPLGFSQHLPSTLRIHPN